MKLSTKSRYGLRACFLLAVTGRRMTTQELTEKSGVSLKYLERIMTALKKHGITEAERGAGGGYCLSDDPSKISIGQIMRALEDNLEFTDCTGDACSDVYCPNRMVFKKLRDGINSILDSYTLADMLADQTCKPAAQG